MRIVSWLVVAGVLTFAGVAGGCNKNGDKDTDNKSTGDPAKTESAPADTKAVDTQPADTQPAGTEPAGTTAKKTPPADDPNSAPAPVDEVGDGDGDGDSDRCVAECVQQNQMRAVGPEVIESDCKKECAAK